MLEGTAPVATGARTRSVRTMTALGIATAWAFDRRTVGAEAGPAEPSG